MVGEVSCSKFVNMLLDIVKFTSILVLRRICFLLDICISMYTLCISLLAWFCRALNLLAVLSLLGIVCPLPPIWYLPVVYLSKICSLLHQRYKDFSPSLIQGLLKVFFPGKSGEDLDADKNLRAMKKRSTLKLLLELYFVGVIEDSGIFINIIKDLTSTEHLKDRDATQTNLTLLASFARQGRVFLGLPLSGQEIQDEVHLVLILERPDLFILSCFFEADMTLHLEF